MKLSRIFLLIIPVLAIFYIGLWYLTCQEIAQHLPQGNFDFAWGKDRLIKLKGTMRAENVHFGGLLQGRASVSFEAKDLAMTWNGIGSVPNLQNIEAKWSTEKGPLQLELTGPLVGKTFGFRVAHVERLKSESKVGNQKSIVSYTTFSPSGWDFQLPGFALLKGRADILSKILERPSKILDLTTGISITPVKGEMFFNESTQPAMTYNYGKTEINYAVLQNSIFHLDGVLDMDAKYGADFFTQIQSLNSAQSAELPPEVVELIQRVQAEVMGDGTFVTRGKFSFEMPASYLGYGAAPKPLADEPPSFSLSLEHFEVAIPFVLSPLRTIDAQIDLLRGKGSPLKFSFKQQVAGMEFMTKLNNIITLVKPKLPADLVRTVDFDRLESTQFNSFAELEGSQGAVVLIMSSLRAYHDLILAEPGVFELSLDMKTVSGKFSVPEMLTVSADSVLNWTMGKGVAIGLKGQLRGLPSWKVEIKISKLSKLLEIFGPTLKVFVARSFLATFFAPTEDLQNSVGATVNESEKSTIQFLFSDALWLDLLESLMQVLKPLDQDPSSPEDLDLLVSGSGASVNLNGKSIAELSPQLQAVTLAELNKLQKKWGAKLSEINPAFAAFFEKGGFSQ